MTRELIHLPAAWIDGAAVADEVPPIIDIVNPATGDLIGTAPVASEMLVGRAVRAAREALPGWAALTPVARDDALAMLADRIQERKQEFAEFESRDSGKPMSVAHGEMDSASELFRFFGGAARVLEGKAAREYVEGRLTFILREPVGVVGQITPWNYPLLMAIWKAGPALAAGNTIVLKPSELTPLTTFLLAEVTEGILPDGVLNVVSGDGSTTGSALTEHRDVDMLCITGSVSTGKRVLEAAVPGVKRTHLELGGKAPVIIFDDADLDLAVAGVRVGAFWNSGQDCTAACRIIVHEDVADEFARRLVGTVEGIVVGDPECAGTEMGPLISEQQRDRVLTAVARAVEQGGRVLTDGHAHDRPEWFVAPTVIAGVEQSHDIVQGEVFGPVVTVQTFRDEDEAVELANGTPYALSASVWTSQLGHSLRMAKRVQAGVVWLNDQLTVADEMPHGGMKMSGYGKDLSTYAIEEFTEIKHVMARLDS